LTTDPSPPIEGRANPFQADSSLRATGEVVSLSREVAAANVGTVARRLTLEEVEARHQDRLDREATLREWVANKVMPAFVTANKWTLIAVAVLVVLDEVNLIFHLVAPGDRIISGQVIMALLGATTVQVGAIAALIARYLFPSR
jgi:hypothetical protein